MTRPRKTPVRTCVGCGLSFDKRDLVRIVRTPEGHIEVDPTGKANGRGAYICPTAECFTKARLRRRLDHSLRVGLRDDDYSRLQRDMDELLSERSSHQGR